MDKFQKCCLRSQSYEFESNSQLYEVKDVFLRRCLRSQSYEFESNSQPLDSSYNIPIVV